jgi:hypothetical protein
MRAVLSILIAALSISAPLAPQSAADAKKFESIKTRHDRGAQVTPEEFEWARRYLAQQRGQDPAEQQRIREAFVRENPPRSSTGLVALPDLAGGTYQGEEGGLFPGGRNTPPRPHLEAGLALAKSVVPLDAAGRRSPDGRIVLLSIGMSNTTMEFRMFQKLAAEEKLNPRLVIVDGAQGGQTARITSSADARFWTVVQQRLENAGVTAAQVQVAWIKQANARPSEGFPGAAKKLQQDLVGTLHNLKQKFPKLKSAYLSSRIYGGHALTPLNPEPYAYEGGFAVKWVIADQIAGKPELNYDASRGEVRAPWVTWGPYLWSDGVKGRKIDDLVWLEGDVTPHDRTHPSESGQRKVAALLVNFLKSDPTARPWFAGK